MITPRSDYSTGGSRTADPVDSGIMAPELVTSRPAESQPAAFARSTYQALAGEYVLTGRGSLKDRQDSRSNGTGAPAPTAQQSSMELATSLGIQRLLWHHAAGGLDSITVDPGVRNGKPMIRGTRISLSQVLDTLADVGSVAAVVEQFPGQFDARAVEEALLFAARLVR